MIARRIKYCVMLFVCLMAIIPMASANTEYRIPNSTAVIGYAGDAGINETIAHSAPVEAFLIYNDGVNKTYMILPASAPDGKMDIITVPVDSGFWGWLGWI